MASEINVYIEGDPALRPGFLAFLAEVLKSARLRRIPVKLAFCKAKAFRSFANALVKHPDAFNVLLVDAEGPVVLADPWLHLQNRRDNSYTKPDDVGAYRAHLMVQVMESWFLADKEALNAYYGKSFRASRLPATSGIEDIPKETVFRALNEAAANTKKGRYHKTVHAPDLLERIDPAKVRAASPWCDRLFATLTSVIQGS